MSDELSIAISPGMQNVSLAPGEVYEGSFEVLNPFPGSREVSFYVTVSPLNFADRTYDITFDNFFNYNQIVNWIEVETPEGTLASSGKAEVKYKITVPENAPGGSQYAAFMVGAKPAESQSQENKVSLSANSQIAMLLYSTVSGENHPAGKILENNIPAVFLDRPIKVSSLVQNTGNVHLEARYILRIFPLLSDEELYSDEESFLTNTVIPETSLYSEKDWDSCPTLGIFRVVQEIQFAEETSIRESYTLVCPTWFFFLAIFFILTIIYAFIDRIRVRNLEKTKIKS